MLKTIAFTFFCIIFLAYYQEINGECCRTTVYVKYFCFKDKPGQCSQNICSDGYWPKGFIEYCANGECNIFGCNCDLGCRQGDLETAPEKFRNRYGYTLVP